MELPFNFIALFLLVAFISTLIKQRNGSKAAQKLPPSPWKLPLIGNLHHLIGCPPHHALRNLSEKHGPLMHFQLGEVSSIVVSSSRLAKELLKTHDLEFADRAEFLATKILCYDYGDIASAPYGDYWRQMRKICAQELLSPKSVRSFGCIRQDEALNLISSIKTLAGAGKIVNLKEKLASYTSSMVCRAAFGKVSKDNHKAFLQLVMEALPLSSAFEISDLFPSLKILHPFFSAKTKLMKVHHKMDVILDKIIDQHIDNLARTKMTMGESGHEDLTDVLLRVKESGDLQFPITKNNVKAVLFDMFLGGTETSSTTLEWAMSELMKNPNVMTKVQNEIRKAFTGKKTIEENEIQQLQYLKLVIKETLRLHPPAPLSVPKQCREQCEIDGYSIPVKTRLFVNTWAIARDPEYWDDPESFKPERFENSSIDFTGNHFELLPFGSGRRICPGISFGIANVELPLTLLLYHFDWRLPNGLSPDDLDMIESVGIATTRKNDLCLLATLYDP
ncbi:premnaspirodiene oxygenase [Coffea arabica]|uniref:Premnaspirodiene oxygenase n=1 Tax=Coffea arabica TaxID=13443 RepID=A0A6P6TS59_COFAR|nr:premnaspirodiene oxygenase-like [Coffea arabica]